MTFEFWRYGFMIYFDDFREIVERVDHGTSNENAKKTESKRNTCSNGFVFHRDLFNNFYCFTILVITNF